MSPISHPTRLSLRMAAAAVAAVLGTTSGLRAQQDPRALPPRIDVALTYAASHSFHTNTDSFWLQGGALDLNARFFRGIGVGASVTGLHVNSNSAAVAPLDLVTVTFGPTYTFHPGRRLSFYSEALLGEAHGFHSVFAYGSGSTSNPAAGTTDSADSLSLQTGGAIDLHLSHHLAVRAIQVDYLRSQLPNGASNVQNNLRLAAGLVARFGRSAKARI